MSPDPPATIADLVEVARVETVVRLDGRSGRLDELVLTGDVAAALSAVLDGAASGGAFFLVGHFGSGKSHLLAALAELLAGEAEGEARAAAPSGWDPALRDAAAAVGPRLVAAVPLVEHRAGAHLEDLALAAAWGGLGAPAPAPGTDRRAAWDGLAAAVADSGRGGLVVLLDELSEFLRAKQGPALVEDLRFLQFLGEWAAGRPAVVVAALQESIEEVANVSERELARIRDRYRTLALSMRHVEDLVRGRLVRVRPGADAAIADTHRALEAAFPGWGVPTERFARTYPLHPATLALLEGLRFLFSQQRGVVDFISRQLLGDPDAGIPPWQERDRAELLPPDRVYDHFRARLHERLETRRLADTVVPYYERAVGELFADAGDRVLALRVVKLLCLLTASPVERPRTATELAHLLLARVSALDAQANVDYLQHAVLDALAGRGAYVVVRPGPAGEQVYTVELEADAAEVAAARLAQARADLQPGDRRVVRTLCALGSSPSLPLALLADVGPAKRDLLWQNTLRSLLVALVRLPELEPADAAALVERAQALGAAGCLLVAEPELDDAALADHAQALAAGGERLAVWVPAALQPGEVDVALDLHARRVVLDQARAEGRTEPGGLVELLERDADADGARARELLARAYFGGAVVGSAGGAGVDLPTLAGLPFERQLRELADPLLSALHPQHQQVAPQGQFVGERLLRQLVTEALAQPRITTTAAERGGLRPLLTGYLAPLGLVRRRGDAWVLAPDPARSPAVAEALRLVPDGSCVPTAEVVRGLADGPVGLTGAEGLVVLNALVQAGMLEAWRGRHRVTAPFLTAAAAGELRVGELLAPAARATLAALAPLAGQASFEPWNAALQSDVWDRARAWLEARREDVAAVRAGLRALADSPVLADAHVGQARTDLDRVAAVVGACDVAAAPAAGLRQLVAAAGEPDGLLAAAQRLAGVARFFREAWTPTEQALGYLTASELALPDDAERLAALRDEALDLARDVLGLAAEDRVGELKAAIRGFRDAYLAAYRAAHTCFHEAPASAAVDAVRASPAYRALAALSDLGAVAVPDDRVKLDRTLATAAPLRCTRRLDVELQWRPRCACGFALGDEPPVVDADGLVARAQRGVRQHLDELARSEHRQRLEQAAEDLVGLGRAEAAADVRRLLDVVARPDRADPLTLVHLVTGPAGPVLRDVLSGGRLVVRRDLAALREDPIGRRYPKRRLLELVTAWVDAGDDLPAGSFVEVVDSAEDAALTASAGAANSPGAHRAGGARAGGARAGGGSAVERLLAERFPRLAALLPGERAVDGFWLAAWWAGRPDPPAWLHADLLSAGDLEPAARAAVADPAARAELAALDARIHGDSLLGDQVAAALGLDGMTARELTGVLAGERYLRHPLRLGATELVRRLASDWQAAERLADLDPAAATVGHALVAGPELAPLTHVLAAARHLAELERRLPAASCAALVEELYPAHGAPVPELLSHAELAAAGSAVVAGEAVHAVRTAAWRVLATADAALADHADAGFPGCLPLWEVGREVVAPLLRTHERVAVLLVDAMRADVWHRLRPPLAATLAGRTLQLRWAVVPEPTRTVEALAGLYSGRRVPAGAGPSSPAELGVPFAHLGVEADALVGVDADVAPGALQALWASGPRLAVAVATGVDQRLHRSSVELAALLDEAVAGLQRRVLPTLAWLPAGVPLVVLADHGFRENPDWGRGGRYAHGGLSLQESVVPVAIFSAGAGGAGDTR